MSAIEKLTFSDTDVIFNYTTGLTDDFVATNMRKIAFSGDVAIGETDANESLGFYPNPASDFISVTGITGQTEVKFYNTTGLNVLNTTIEKNDAINISSLQKGMYFVVLESDLTKLTFRIIKN